MKNLMDRAGALAEEMGQSTTTGHVLLALTGGGGTATRAANFLEALGVSEGKVRPLVRDLGVEPDEAWEAFVDRSHRLAVSFRTNGPSPLQALAAIAAIRDCHGARVLAQLGRDLGEVHTRVLSCLTGVPAERAAGKALSSSVERQEALPLATGLRTLAPLPPRKEAEPPRIRRAAAPPPAVPGDHIARIIEAGRDLESKQRRTRAQRIPAAPGAADPTDRPRRRAARARMPAETPAPPAPAAAPDPMPIDGERFPLLASLGRDLTAEAAAGRLDAIIGREVEIERIADVLNKRRSNSPCLVGPPGVGKTAVVEGLAARMARGEVPGLEGRALVEIRPGDLISGTSLRGALAERLAQLRAEVSAAEGRVILFLDEIHALLGSSDGAEAVQELKTALGRGELPCIAATTDEAFRTTIASDPALTRRFNVIEVEEPCEADALAIVEGVVPAYRQHHGVEFTPEAMQAAVRLATRYVPDRALPDKAVALLDLAGARARRAGEEAVDAAAVARLLADQIGVPPERLVADDQERLLNLEAELSARVIGHEHVLEALGETLRRNAAGFRTGRPIGSFLFLGPTGVGKTETAKALAQMLFPGGKAVIRLDMSEFAESHAVARMVGAPPGYVGHEDGGQLTEAVRRRPYSLVLLDEIEKAHRDVIQVLLQVLDDGRLTDGRGHTISMQNTVIVMTSNLGAQARPARRSVGFGAPQQSDTSGVADAVLAAARAAMPPELWNRIDEPLVFAPLTRPQVGSIAGLMLQHLSRQLEAEHGIALEFADDTVESLILAGGYDPDLGARPMRRTIQRMVEGPVARLVLAGEATRGDRVVLIGDGERLVCQRLAADDPAAGVA